CAKSGPRFFDGLFRQPFRANVRRNHPTPEVKHVDIQLQRARQLRQRRPPWHAKPITFKIRDPLLRDRRPALPPDVRRQLDLRQPELLAPLLNQLAQTLQGFCSPTLLSSNRLTTVALFFSSPPLALARRIRRSPQA